MAAFVFATAAAHELESKARRVARVSADAYREAKPH
jgi:hypothetical protein